MTTYPDAPHNEMSYYSSRHYRRPSSASSFDSRAPPPRRSDNYYYYSDDNDTRSRRRGSSLSPYETSSQNPGRDAQQKDDVLKKGLIAGALVVAVGAFTVWHRKKAAERERMRKERRKRDFERAKRRRRREEEKRDREMEVEEMSDGVEEARDVRRIEYFPEKRGKSRGRREIEEDEDVVRGRAESEPPDGARERQYERARSRV